MPAGDRDLAALVALAGVLGRADRPSPTPDFRRRLRERLLAASEG